MEFSPTAFDLFAIRSPYLEMWAAFAGLLVGSFLNVLAVRSLAGESIFYPLSKCPHCHHRLGILEIVPVLSYFLQRGRCRHCHEKINWHYPLVEAVTAVLYAVIVHHFAEPIFESAPDRLIVTYAMLIFASVLVAVTVTDFKEKLIPHEITYPSIIGGLLYSFWVRHDLLGALAGVGVSYILFDFIAFYGLKLYVMRHPELNEEAEQAETATTETKSKSQSEAAESAVVENSNDENAVETKEPIITPLMLIDEDRERVAHEEEEKEVEKEEEVVEKELVEPISETIAFAEKINNPTATDEDDEPFEVMGGGDAVLSAVLAAWLGWKLLIAALVVGFMVGAIMGACYLIFELKKQDRLKMVTRPALIGTSIAGGAFTVLVFGLAAICHMPEMMTNPTVWLLDLIVAVGGTTIGVIASGESITKPFPFGPALAVGGLYALFLINLSDQSYILNMLR